MTPTKWAVLALVAAVLLVGSGALSSYLVLRSPPAAWKLYADAGSHLAHDAADSVRAAQKVGLDSMGKLLAVSNVHAQAGQKHDVIVKADSGIVAASDSLLKLAHSALDSLRAEHLGNVARDTSIGDLTLSRNDWRGAFNDQAQANAQLTMLYAGDTLFRSHLLAHIDSLPKPPRGGLLGWLLRPKPFVRAGYNSRTGTYVDGGMCLGCSQ